LFRDTVSARAYERMVDKLLGVIADQNQQIQALAGKPPWPYTSVPVDEILDPWAVETADTMYDADQQIPEPQ
jgi:hypothetical protein